MKFNIFLSVLIVGVFFVQQRALNKRAEEFLVNDRLIHEVLLNHEARLKNAPKVAPTSVPDRAPASKVKFRGFPA